MTTQTHLASLSHSDDQFAQCIDHPSGFLALSPKNRRFSLPNCPGLIAYRQQGKHLIAFGGIHAPREHAERLLDGFIQFAEAQRRRVLVVQARESQVPLLRGRGFTVNQFGSNFCLQLGAYSFAGARKMKLRNKLRRARRAGLRVVEVGRELQRTPAVFDTLHRISNAWLAQKHKKELDFMVGEIGAPDELRRRIFLVQNEAGDPHGFITYVPAWCDRPGLLHDLTRRLPTAPPGSMELCNAFAMERLREEGVAYLHFGFTPFIVDTPEPQGGNQFFAWTVRKTHRYGGAIYPAESQARYKMKWGVDFIDREYLAARPLTFRALLDLLLLTRSL